MRTSRPSCSISLKNMWAVNRRPVGSRDGCHGEHPFSKAGMISTEEDWEQAKLYAENLKVPYVPRAQRQAPAPKPPVSFLPAPPELTAEDIIDSRDPNPSARGCNAAFLL